MLGDALGAGIVYHLSKDELEGLGEDSAEKGDNDEQQQRGRNGIEKTHKNGNGVSNETFELEQQ